MYAVLAALIDVGNGDTVPTDINELMEQISCLKCAIQPGDVGLLILGAVSNITGGGGGGGGVTCGAVDPVAAPSGSCALYVNTVAQSLWYWDGVSWTALIV